MKFSVLMSVYIKENPIFLKQALESIINQTIRPNEIVLMEDGPLTIELNNTIKEFKEKFPNILKNYKLKKNVGLGNALKIGLRNCKNEIIARMDTDDIAVKTRFEKQLEILKKNEKITVVGSNMYEFLDNLNNIQTIKVVPEKICEIRKFSKKRNPMNHPTVMFRKKIILEVGNYENQLLYEDYLLWIKILSKGYEMYNIQENLLYFRANQNSFKRRGGISRVLKDLKFQNKMFFKYKWINTFEYLRNIILKTLIIIIPNKMRSYIYKNYLREKTK